MSLFHPEINILPVAITMAVFFGAVNLFGAKQSATFQVTMVVGLLVILVWFIATGSFEIQQTHFSGFFDKGSHAVFSTAGLVYISYVGVTNVASVAEEIHNPERNLPLGIILAMATAVVIYIAGMFVMIGVIPKVQLYGDLTPVATAARIIFGKTGVWLVTGAAILAFFSVANAGILSASRYPMAMSRDHLLPGIFKSLSARQMPKYSIYLTVALIILCLLLFDPLKIAKLASAFQLLMLSFLCLAVIVMRESKIQSYDPGYRSPFYPWTQIIGIAAPLWLISAMGFVLIAATLGLVTLGVVWYFYYARVKVHRSGAIYHIFARLGAHRFDELDSELRGILREKGLREEDPFDMVVGRAHVVNMENRASFDEVVSQASQILSERVKVAKDILYDNFMQGTRIGNTPVSHGVALPHMRLPHISHPEMVIVRSTDGVRVELDKDVAGVFGDVSKPIHAFFFLVSPDDDPGQHLRILAKLAEHADDEQFMVQWLEERTEQELKEILHREERFLSVVLTHGSSSASMIGKKVSELDMPEGTLITMIHRSGELVVPRGRTVLQAGDRITIIGDTKDIEKLSKMYGEL